MDDGKLLSFSGTTTIADSDSAAIAASNADNVNATVEQHAVENATEAKTIAENTTAITAKEENMNEHDCKKEKDESDENDG